MEATQMELSAMRSIVNGGMAVAAKQLSGLLLDTISLDVAHVTISPLEQVLPLLRLGNVQVACIWQQVRGEIKGSAMLLLHPDDCLALTGALLGNVPSLSEAANGVVQHEALTEIANIIVSSCISEMSAQLGLPITLSVPEFFEQKLTTLFDDALADLDGGKLHNQAQVMVMSVALTAARRPINSTLVMMLGLEAMQSLMKRLDTGGSV